MPDLQWFAITDTLVAWLLTYAVHSTLLLAGAWLISSKLSLASRETVWKSAIVGGLFTATLQLIAGPAVGAPAHRITPPSTEAMLGSAAASPIAAATRMLQGAPGADVATHGLASESVAGGSLGSHRGQLASTATTEPSWRQGVALAWALLAAMTLLMLATAYRRLRLRLAHRESIVDGPILGLLETLRQRSGIPRAPRLSRSQALRVPIARGILRPEICLPEQALDLAEAHQESLLAHELAHVQRRDPAWLVLNRVLESTFFFQPLNVMARHRLQEIAEFRCDDLAARWTGRPESLAGCLTEVAAWSLRDQRTNAGALAPSLAAKRKSLRQRVCRLLDNSPTANERSSWWMQPALGAALVLFALAAPGFTPADGAPAAPQAPEAYQAPEPAPAPAPAPVPDPAPAAASAPAPVPTPAVAPTAPPTPKTAPAAPTPPVAPVPRVRSQRTIPGHVIPGQTIPGQTISVPEIRIPEIRVPEFRVPEIQIPKIHVPEINMPDQNIHVPEINIPARTIPEMLIPEIEIPEIHMPARDIEIPDMEIPEIHLDELKRINTAQLEASLAKLEAVEARFEASHSALMEEFEHTIETSIGPAMEKAHAAASENVENQLEQLEEEIKDAHQEGNAEREEALRNVQEELRTVLQQQHERVQPYQEILEDATAVYHRELSQRHNYLDDEQAEEIRAELDRAREAMRQEIAHRHTEQRAQLEEMRTEQAQREAQEQRHEAREERERAREEARRQ